MLFPELLEDSQYPPENTPVYKIRRDLIELVSNGNFIMPIIWI